MHPRVQVQLYFFVFLLVLHLYVDICIEDLFQFALQYKIIHKRNMTGVVYFY